jgi:phage-related protein
MSNSIYNVGNWSINTQYSRNDIVIQNNLYYYAAFNHTSSSDFPTDLNNGSWAGNIYMRGTNYPQFVWVPSYNFTNQNKPKIKSIVFNGGYEQTLSDGINNLLLDYNLSFEVRTLSEITAILHFLSVRLGNQSFAWIPPAPRNNLLIFKCKEWSDTQKFFGNYNITATFTQFPV